MVMMASYRAGPVFLNYGSGTSWHPLASDSSFRRVMTSYAIKIKLDAETPKKSDIIVHYAWKGSLAELVSLLMVRFRHHLPDCR
jgi:hypothetical protein